MPRKLFAITLILVLPILSAGALRLRTPDKSLPIGKWRVEFANGVVQTSTNGEDGPAFVTEPGRTSPGKWNVRDGAIVIAFADDRLERWRLVDQRWVVEHWCPSSTFPNHPPVVGVAKTTR